MNMRGLLTVLVCGLMLLAVGNAGAGPMLAPWEYWQTNNPKSSVRVNHHPWDQFLNSYVVFGEDGSNRLLYSKVMRQDKRLLADYLASLAGTQVTALSRPAQLAFWVNLYNALTVKVVLDHLPVESIKDIDISPGLFARGPWEKKLITIEGLDINLLEIEERILRPIWQDPRIHYVLTRAAIGSPNLQPQAMTPENSEEFLNRATRDFINDRRGVLIEGKTLQVSSLYRWYGDDFGKNDAEIIAHLLKYANPFVRPRLAAFKQIDKDQFNWALNAAD